jgi:hypothetical protein
MGIRHVAATLWRDRRARRRGLVVLLGSWLVFALVSGGGLVQYVPDGWVVPLRTWIAYAHPTPYGFYAFDENWAIVPVPLYLAQSLGVALLAGTYVWMASTVRSCGTAPRRRDRALGVTGWAAGILGAAACCSPLAMALGLAIGGGLAARITGIGLWASAALLAGAIAIESRRLGRCTFERATSRTRAAASRRPPTRG